MMSGASVHPCTNRRPHAAPLAGRAVRRMTLACCLASALLLAQSAAAADASLAKAAEQSDWLKVRTLLSQGADPNAAQVDGMTALHWAVYHDQLDAAKQILAAGGNAKAENRYGVTPLSLACVNGT